LGSDGHTAAEIIALRADAKAKNMGLTHWDKASTGGAIDKKDVTIAKNYLQEDELLLLNRIVNAYLEFAELQAQGRRAMAMNDWMVKLDDFLRLTERDVLTHAGKLSSDAAETYANKAFLEYQANQADLPSRAEQDFEHALLAPIKALLSKRKK
jgi:hypothetical protein